MASRRGLRSGRSARRGNRVIVYVRVSEIGGRGDDLISDDVQADVCKRAAERDGLVIVDTVSDIDLSGRGSKKRQIARVIDRVREGDADGVIVWKISRWGRNLLDSLLNVGELQEAGGFVASATENLDDIETPMGRFSLTQMLAIAQLQSDQIGETWQNVGDYRRGMGLPHTGGPRFGYDYNGDKKDPEKVYAVNPVTGPWLRKCYEGYVSGRSVAGMCDELRENSILSVRGRPIVYRSLIASLDSGFGAGLIVDRRSGEEEFLPGAQEPVISKELWEAYRAKRSQPRSPREKAAVHRLSGLLYCAGCRRKMRVHWQIDKARDVRKRGFKCAISKYATTQVCPSPASISQVQVEERVFEWLQAHKEGDEALNTALERKAHATKARADIESLDKEIVRVQQRLSRLTDMLLDQDEFEHAKETFKEKQREIRAELEALKARRESLSVEADVSEIPSQGMFRALALGWKYMDPPEMNEGLRKVIARIEVSPGARVVKGRVRVIGRWESEAQAEVANPNNRSRPRDGLAIDWNV